MQEDPSHYPQANEDTIPYLLPALLKIPQELNDYYYVVNSPINIIDPTGLYSFSGGNPQTPGCDMFPDFNSCATKCCNKHDRCFEINGCNMLTWGYTGAVTANASACVRCNITVMKCLIKAFFDCDEC